MNMNAKILVVDDDSAILSATRRVLEQAGYETLGAPDGEAALEVTRAQRPDLVLLDVNMPKMDGLEACRLIKADPALAGIFIIIMSSTSTDSDSRADGLNMGADGYISRPIANRELLARVQAMLRIQAGEHALQVSNAQWSATFDAVNDAIFLTDVNYTILKCNQAAAEIWQRPLEAMVGKKCYEVAHGTETPASTCPLAMVRETKRREIITFTQNERWLEAKVDPMFDAAGNFSGTVHVITDITERKLAETALEASEEKYRLLIQNSAEAIYVVQDGLFKFANRKCGELLGLTEQELSGKSIDAFVLPEDIELLKAHHLGVIQGKLDDTPLEVQIPVPGKAATWLSISAVRIDWAGKSATLNFASDITARKQAETALRESEDKFKYIFDHSVIGKSITLPTGELNVNQAFCKMLGYSTEELNNRTWQEISHPDDLELTRTEMNALLANQRESTLFIKRYLHKNGSILWAEVGTALRRDAEGKPLYFMTTINNITERKQAEDALRESEDKYRRLFENTSLGIFQSTPEGKAISVNQAFARMFGYDSPADTLKSIRNVATDVFADPNRRAEIIRLMAENPDLKTFENIYRRKDGSTFIGNLNSMPVKDAHGRLILLEGLIEDITERKQAEQALRKSETRLRAMLDATPFPIALVDVQDNNIDFWSSSALTLFGHTAPTTEQWYQMAYPDPEYRQDVIERWKPALEKAQRTAQSVNTGEYQVTCRDGSVRICELYATFLDDSLIVTFNDITERKRAEEALRETTERLAHMLTNSPTVIYALKVEGGQATPIWISDNIESVLGFKAEDGLRPEWWMEQIDPQYRPEALASLEHLFDDFYQHEYRFTRKDGQVIWLHDQHRLLRDADRQPWEIIGAWTDITSRKQAEDALKEYNTRLETAVEARTHELREAQEQLVHQEKLAVLGQLAGSVGHELRNPLGIINNAVYFLRMIQPEADEKVREYLGIIDTETHTADKIISDLLDFSRIKSVDVEPVAVSDLVRRTLERFPAPENVQVTLNLSENLPTVYIDPRQMTQVLGNLLLNACQAMPKGGQLSVISQQCSVNPDPLNTDPLNTDSLDTGHWILITVTDTGSGIQAENMKKLFEPLFTTKPKGIGLGLAVSQKLVEANGGRIEVESEPGKGSTFTVWLPVHSVIARVE